jgi:hypothetical protein
VRQGSKLEHAPKRWIGAALLVLAGAAVAGENGLQLRASSSDDGWSRVQGRLTLGVHGASLYDAPTAFDATAPTRLHSLSLLGDYYLTRPLGANGGLRATGGVLLGPRTLLLGGLPAQGGFQVARRSSLTALPADGSDDNGTVPYFGIGYTSLSLRGGWGLAVDFGLMALNPRSAGQFGGVLTGSQSLDGTLRDLRLAPVIQLGVSYAF